MKTKTLQHLKIAAALAFAAPFTIAPDARPVKGKPAAAKDKKTTKRRAKNKAARKQRRINR